MKTRQHIGMVKRIFFFKLKKKIKRILFFFFAFKFGIVCFFKKMGKLLFINY